MGEVLSRLPRWLLLLAGILLVVLTGVVDYLTGDYSILIFYLAPIALVSWYVDSRWGLGMAVLSGMARFSSDYAGFTNTPLMYWNCLEDATFLLLVAFLISVIKKQLTARKE